MFAMWVKMFYWMKTFKRTSVFLQQMVETALYVVPFGIVYVGALVAFATFFYILDRNVPEGSMLDNDNVQELQFRYVEPLANEPPTFYDAFLNMYLLSLGEFAALDGYALLSGHDNVWAMLMFLLATVVLMLVLLNFIVTIMAEPFAAVNEAGDVHQYK